MYKVVFYKILLSIAVLICSIMLTNFIIDPIQIYRSASYRPVYILERYQAMGHIKRDKYELAIVGTSTAQNFDKIALEVLFGKKILNLTLQGASSYELGLVLSKALETKTINEVIYGIDLFKSYDCPIDKTKSDFPSYFYDKHELNDIKYLINFDVMINYYPRMTLLNLGILDGKYVNELWLYRWDDSRKFGKDEVVNNYKGIIGGGGKLKASVVNISLLKQSFDKNTLPLVQNNKKVKFKFFFPPYSILAYKAMGANGTLASFLEFKGYVVSSLSKFDNVEIYDFQKDLSIITDLNNYTDITHYNSSVAMKNYKNIATSAHSDSNLSDALFLQAIQRYSY